MGTVPTYSHLSSFQRKLESPFPSKDRIDGYNLGWRDHPAGELALVHEAHARRFERLPNRDRIPGMKLALALLEAKDRRAVYAGGGGKCIQRPAQRHPRHPALHWLKNDTADTEFSLTNRIIDTKDIVSEETSGMAAARNNLSRRAVLGAAFAAPAIIGGAAAARPACRADRRRWEPALATLRQAEATMETFRTHHMHPADHIYHAIRSRWPSDYDFSEDAGALETLTVALTVHESFEERLNDLESARLSAVKRLLRTPAPDLPAMAMKIGLVVDHAVAELEGGEQCLAMLKADAWRLARVS